MHGSPPRSGRRRCARLIDGNLVIGPSITEAILEAVPVWRVVQCPGEAGRAVSARDEPSGHPAQGAALRRTAAAGVQSGPARRARAASCPKRPFTTHADRLRPRLKGERFPAAGRVRAGADPRMHPGRPQGRADATAAGRSRCRKPRCDWPRPRWRTAAPPCPRSDVNLGSTP